MPSGQTCEEATIASDIECVEECVAVGMASGCVEVQFVGNGTVQKKCLHHWPPWCHEIAASTHFPTHVIGKSFDQWFAKRAGQGHEQEASAEIVEIHQVIGAINPRSFIKRTCCVFFSGCGSEQWTSSTATG